MKNIILIPDAPLYNYVDIRVLDKKENGEKRQRCIVTCEFAEYDVRQLQNKGLSFDEAMESYRSWLYTIVKVNLADDWICDEGYDEVIGIISENVARFY